MKKNFLVIAAITFAVIIGFSLTGCPTPDDENNNTTQPLFSVSGEFNGATNGKALFKARTAETVSRSARSAVSTHELTGELEDGDMVFRLKGTYDSSTGSYNISSASSFARYTVSGNKNGATATLAVKDGDDWKSFVVSVTIKEVTVKDGDVQDIGGGLPAWVRGGWHHQWSEKQEDYEWSSSETWSYFDQWYYEGYKSSVWRGNWDFTATKYTAIEVDKINDDAYDVIFSYPHYKATKEQKLAALEQFFKEKKHHAEHWDYEFAPWDQSVWERTDAGVDKGKNWDNSVIWYICINDKHKNSGRERYVNWETFDKLSQEIKDGFWNLLWQMGQDEAGWYDTYIAVSNYFKEKNVSNYYYWGWHEKGWNTSDDHESRSYSCWAPSCEDGWWNKTRYFSEWGNGVGFHGDWNQHGDIFQKWDEENYLIKYLISKGVQPQTWYTRVRLTKQDYGFLFQYYDNKTNRPADGGDLSKEAFDQDFAAPPCDTRSLLKIKALTFDSTYLGWSNDFRPQ